MSVFTASSLDKDHSHLPVTIAIMVATMKVVRLSWSFLLFAYLLCCSLVMVFFIVATSKSCKTFYFKTKAYNMKCAIRGMPSGLGRHL
jgi:hypothetical protein